MSLDELITELKKFGIDAQEIIFESGGLAKIIAGAIQLAASGDFIISSQGKASHDAVGSYQINVSQDLVAERVRAYGAQLIAAGMPIAELGIEASLGKIIAENLHGSFKGQLDEILDEMKTILEETGDAIIKTGNGDGVVSPQTKSKFSAIKGKIASAKAKNSMIFK